MTSIATRVAPPPTLTTADLRLCAGERRRGLRYHGYCGRCWDSWGLYRTEVRQAPIRCVRCGNALVVRRGRRQRVAAGTPLATASTIFGGMTT